LIQGALASCISNKHAIDKTASAAHFQEILKVFDMMPLYLATKMSLTDKTPEPKEFSQLTQHSCKRCEQVENYSHLSLMHNSFLIALLARFARAMIHSNP